MLSPSNAQSDLIDERSGVAGGGDPDGFARGAEVLPRGIDKMQVLQLAGVPHYWIGNPQEETLVVHRWEPKGYLIVLTAASGDVVRAEPFEAIELRVDVIFGDGLNLSASTRELGWCSRPNGGST